MLKTHCLFSLFDCLYFDGAYSGESCCNGTLGLPLRVGYLSDSAIVNRRRLSLLILSWFLISVIRSGNAEKLSLVPLLTTAFLELVSFILDSVLRSFCGFSRVFSLLFLLELLACCLIFALLSFVTEWQLIDCKSANDA